MLLVDNTSAVNSPAKANFRDYSHNVDMKEIKVELADEVTQY